MSSCLCDATDAVEQVYCCEALPAWGRARYREAGEAAARALALDAGYSPAWLLYAFARYKEGHRTEAMGLLEGLARDEIVGSRARRAIRVNHHRHDRDQLHVSGGFEIGAGAAPLVVVDLPIADGWGARVDVRRLGWYEAELRGWGGALAGTWSATAGVWRVQLVAGIEGFVDTTSIERLRPGALAGTRVDARLVQSFGLGAEIGGATLLAAPGIESHPYARLFATLHAPARRRW